MPIPEYIQVEGADGIAGIRVAPGGGADRFHVQHQPPQQAAAVVELADGQAIMPLDRLHQPGEAGDEAVVIDPEAVVVRPPAGGDRHRLGDDSGDAALGAELVVQSVAFGGEAVAGTEIGAHGRHDQPVLQGEPADLAGLAQPLHRHVLSPCRRR